ncbi:MAG: aminotransferase class V-fold PLP-dependent enzyme [Vicinamibacterales bacterium]
MSNETTRRAMLRRLTGGLAFLPTAAYSLAELSTTLAAAEDDDGYWELVRQQFAFSEAKVPVNAANLCPSPRVVAEAVAELTRDIDVDCSFNNRNKFRHLQESARDKVAAHLGVTGDEVALVRNTSEANNIINGGLPLKSGDEVVIWDQNHPTNNVAWDVRAARYGITVKRVSTPLKPSGVDELVGTFEKALSPRTRVLSVTHVSNVSGIRLPVKELTELGHRRGLHVHVDGAQSLGVLHFSLRDIGCDSYSSSAHKWWVGPKEVGVLYVRADRIKDIWPHIVAPGWGDTADTILKGARKFESLGQRDDAAVAAMGTTADFHAMVGAARIAARVTALATQLKQGLQAMGATLVTPMDPAISGGVCIVEAVNDKRQKLLDGLYAKHGIAGSASGGLRLCPHLYNTRQHVQRTVDGVKALKDLLT